MLSRIEESEDEGCLEIDEGIKKHRTTIGKVDNTSGLADKETSQSSKDIRFARC